MIYYFLPNADKYGGVKVGCQLVDALNQLGLSAVVVTPDGRAPDWFRWTMTSGWVGCAKSVGR